MLRDAMGVGRRSSGVLAVTLVTLLVFAPTTVAQEGRSPTVVLEAAEIDVEVGNTTAVQGVYRFRIADKGSGSRVLTAFTGKHWQFPEAVVSDYEARIEGQEAPVDTEPGSGHVDVDIPVPEGMVEDGDLLNVTLEFTVQNPDGLVKTPLWVPDHTTLGEGRPVSIRVALPSDSHAGSDNFPRPDRITGDGSVLEHRVAHVPGFVYTTYSDRPAGVLSQAVILSAVGIVGILAVVGAWGYWIRRSDLMTGEGDADVP